jgi:hypothetical protein
MGKLPSSAFEVRLAATLFLLLLGLANLFGAWEVRNFASFTPSGVAAAVGPAGDELSEMNYMSHMSHMHEATPAEKPVSLETLNAPKHHIDRELLVQDSHVHIPVYALTAAALVLIVLGLRLSSRTRVAIVLLAFSAPTFDFAGLWGAHLWQRSGRAWGAVAVLGGAMMGLAYLAVLALTLKQCWFSRIMKGESDA